MKKRIIALLLVFILTAALLAACGPKKSSMLTVEEAQQIALKEFGHTESKVSEIHAHVTTYEGIPCYSIHITMNGSEYEYIIDALTGDVLN